MNILDLPAQMLDAIIDRLFPATDPDLCFDTADGQLWAAARTLDDLGQLTARWLAGEIGEQPNYGAPVDVDEDDVPGLTGILISLNRSGFVTKWSQAGFDGPGPDGAHWVQFAGVDGFASDDALRRIRTALDGTRFVVIAKRVRTGLRPGKRAVYLTWREGRPFTRFGWHMRRWQIAATVFQGCSPEAIDALAEAWQVTVYDPASGSNDLWPVLAAAASAAVSWGQ